jgi:hypothetical protein
MAAGGAFDEPLETRPETRLLQRPVEPASRDAQVSFVRRYVVNAVVPPRQDQMPVLQALDRPRQFRVRVRPFVDLSGDASRFVD